jgi:hypothetical protein
MGYGHAEALLFKKHPHRFSEGGIRWEGCVYRGIALGIEPGDFIYSGPTGEAPYQSLGKMLRQPMRGLHPNFDTPITRILLTLLSWLQTHLRHWKRKQNGGPSTRSNWPKLPLADSHTTSQLILTHADGSGRHELYRLLLENGWQPCSDPDFDLQCGSCKLLAATEQTSTPENRTFIAMSEPSNSLPALAFEAGFTSVNQMVAR